MDISVMFTSVENYIIYVFQVMDISVMFTSVENYIIYVVPSYGY